MTRIWLNCYHFPLATFLDRRLKRRAEIIENLWNTNHLKGEKKKISPIEKPSEACDMHSIIYSIPCDNKLLSP